MVRGNLSKLLATGNEHKKIRLLSLCFDAAIKHMRSQLAMIPIVHIMDLESVPISTSGDLLPRAAERYRQGRRLAKHTHY